MISSNTWKQVVIRSSLRPFTGVSSTRRTSYLVAGDREDKALLSEPITPQECCRNGWKFTRVTTTSWVFKPPCFLLLWTKTQKVWKLANRWPPKDCVCGLILSLRVDISRLLATEWVWNEILFHRCIIWFSSTFYRGKVSFVEYFRTVCTLL